MLLSLIKYFRGYVEVSLWGYAPERFFNLCSNHNILLWDLCKQGDVYCFKISVQGFRSLKPLLQKTGTHIRIGKKNGIPFLCFRYRKRKILFASIFLCMGILFALSRFVWKININGNDSVTNDSMLKFLEANNSSYGTHVSNIDCTKLEEEIRDCFESIIWTSVKREGTTLTIDVQENLSIAADQPKAKLPKEFQNQEKKGFDLIALHDGTIESIYVRKGTPCVKQGDTVKKGDVLVSGALPIYDDSQTIVDYQYCTADADIRLNAVYAYKDRFPIQYEKRVYSGQIQKRYGLSFGDSYVQLPWKNVPYRQYTVMEDRIQLRLCDSFYLPLYFVKRSYEDYETVRVNYTMQEAKEQAQKNLSEFLKKLTQKGVLILQKRVMIKKGKNNYIVSGNLAVSENTFQYAVNKEQLPDTENEGNASDESE